MQWAAAVAAVRRRWPTAPRHCRRPGRLRGGLPRLAQGEFGRFGQQVGDNAVSGEMVYQTPYGVIAPPQKFALRIARYLHDHGIGPRLRAIALASYHHAQANPRAVMHGKPLDAARYDAARWIVEPLRLYDCCMENDGAAAVLLVAAERARDFAQPPAYLLGAAGGGEHRSAAQPHNAPAYASANYRGIARDLYAMAGAGRRAACSATRTSPAP